MYHNARIMIKKETVFRIKAIRLPGALKDVQDVDGASVRNTAAGG